VWPDDVTGLWWVWPDVTGLWWVWPDEMVGLWWEWPVGRETTILDLHEIIQFMV